MTKVTITSKGTYFEGTHLPEMLKRSRCQLDLQIQTLMMLDSLELEKSHRSLIRVPIHLQIKYSSPTNGPIVESAAFSPESYATKNHCANMSHDLCLRVPLMVLI